MQAVVTRQKQTHPTTTTAIIRRAPPIVLVWNATVAPLPVNVGMVEAKPASRRYTTKQTHPTTTKTAIIIRAPRLCWFGKLPLLVIVGMLAEAMHASRFYNNKEREAATTTKTDSSNNNRDIARAPLIVLLWKAVVAGNRRNIRGKIDPLRRDCWPQSFSTC